MYIFLCTHTHTHAIPRVSSGPGFFQKPPDELYEPPQRGPAQGTYTTGLGAPLQSHADFSQKGFRVKGRWYFSNPTDMQAFQRAYGSSKQGTPT